MRKAALDAPTTGSRVLSVSRSSKHSFSKDRVESVLLVEGLGVDGDAHSGTTVQHVFRKRSHPTEPNLRQVHLIHAELFDELEQDGFELHPGDLGENITTRGIELLDLPEGTLLRIGPDAVVQVTGLRSPCRQIDRFQTGLLKAVLPRDSAGKIVRKTGIMGIVLTGGLVSIDDEIRTEVPAGPHRRLKCV
ncbi:MOSC domain-containing protein [Arthrobacter sp. zg-Y820]|uniref:MOSC domain-containing protein n=1 Tax=unclassified Arthrobacter TaxID=235627 RepID=UPI001E4B67D3|nr:MULTISPECIES: MOSC domain-containing protein [unclassified Arthrobacter]MCC9196950.1 MOSC domain-containing protein [Arthrobacter sp. zg-Y820]MDK1279815.1 MOSC domain-containing protein [Arthrobacter sp. zg.Y820]WIB10933.1 MOSC domain-containing protein [Arthrobacter sp. zg-Y820]